MSIEVRWITAFLDRPASTYDASAEFWCAVTGSHLSAMRGDHDEFTTLLPAGGDANLRMQRVTGGDGGTHLDLHVDDPVAAAAHAREAGATIAADLGDYLVARSPGGLPFCLVSHHGEQTPPAPHQVECGPRSVVDQVCIDVPPDAFDDECAFWSALTGHPLGQTMDPEFRYLDAGRQRLMRVLFQREEDSRPGPCRAHVDLGCDDVEAATAHHLSLGASVRATHEWWTVLIEPSGHLYCLLRRPPRV